MMETTTRFSGDALRRIRHEKGWTQAELARRAGVRERQIIRWENNQNEPRIEAVANLAGVTGEKLAAFLVTDQEATPLGDTFRGQRNGTGRGSDRTSEASA